MQITYLLPVESQDTDEIPRGIYTKAVSLGERVRCGKCGKRIPLGEYRYVKTEPIEGGVEISVLCSDDYIDLQVNKGDLTSWNGELRKVTMQKARRGAASKRKRMRGTSLQGEQT